MSYLSRACMAASVAVVRDHTADNGGKSLRSAKSLFLSTGLLPVIGFGLNRVQGGAIRPEDDSVRQAMYISCWGPS